MVLSDVKGYPFWEESIKGWSTSLAVQTVCTDRHGPPKCKKFNFF